MPIEPLSRRVRLGLALGPVMTLAFVAGLAGLPFLIPFYDPVRQTVSELGEVGSPAALPFTALLLGLAIGMVVFALAVAAALRHLGRPVWGAALVGLMAVPLAGIAAFPYPHPLHNWFGLSELIPYQAPWVFALALGKAEENAPLRRFSFVMAVVVWMAILVNLNAVVRLGPVWTLIKPVYGMIQRTLFLTWFTWAAGVGLLLAANPDARP